MKVAQILPRLDAGGVERGVVDLNREFARRGIDSVVISSGGAWAAKIEEDGGAHFHSEVASKNPLTAPARALRLRALLAQIAPDIAHIRSRVPAWLFRFANRKLGLPAVSTLHGLNRRGRYSRAMVDFARVICPSAAALAHAKNVLGADETKLRLAPRGIDLAHFDPAAVDAAAARARRGWDGRVVALSVGRLGRGKGHDIFIRAVRRARETKPALLGVVVGGGDPRALSALAALADSESIVFVGAQKDMRECYAAADLVVSAARKPESFGRTMAEALAMNKPTLAAAHGGALDIVRPPNDGAFFAPENEEELSRLLAAFDPAPRVGLREGIIARFSLAQMTQKTIAVYEEVLAEKSRADAD